MQLILASQSPRRKELLGLFRLPFSVQVADIDETMDPSLPPAQEVARVSRAKAEAISRTPEDIVIAADNARFGFPEITLGVLPQMENISAWMKGESGCFSQ